MNSSIDNDIKVFLSVLFNKPVNDFDIQDFRVYRKFYKSFCLMFGYSMTEIIIIINKFKKSNSKNLITYELINKFEMMSIIPIVHVEDTRINFNELKPLKQD